MKISDEGRAPRKPVEVTDAMVRAAALAIQDYYYPEVAALVKSTHSDPGEGWMKQARIALNAAFSVMEPGQ